MVFSRARQKLSAAFTDCRAYWRALGSLLYIGHAFAAIRGSERGVMRSSIHVVSRTLGEGGGDVVSLLHHFSAE